MQAGTLREALRRALPRAYWIVSTVAVALTVVSVRAASDLGAWGSTPQKTISVALVVAAWGIFTWLMVPFTLDQVALSLSRTLNAVGLHGTATNRSIPRLVRIHRRHSRAQEEVREIFQTLVDDGSLSLGDPRGVLDALEAAEGLATPRRTGR